MSIQIVRPATNLQRVTYELPKMIVSAVQSLFPNTRSVSTVTSGTPSGFSRHSSQTEVIQYSICDPGCAKGPTLNYIDPKFSVELWMHFCDAAGEPVTIEVDRLLVGIQMRAKHENLVYDGLDLTDNCPPDPPSDACFIQPPKLLNTTAEVIVTNQEFPAKVLTWNNSRTLLDTADPTKCIMSSVTCSGICGNSGELIDYMEILFENPPSPTTGVIFRCQSTSTNPSSSSVFGLANLLKRKV